MQRRKEALKKLEKRQREQRLEERAEVGQGACCGWWAGSGWRLLAEGWPVQRRLGVLLLTCHPLQGPPIHQPGPRSLPSRTLTRHLLSPAPSGLQRRQAMKEEMKRIGADLSASDSERGSDEEEDKEEAAPAQQRVYKSSEFVSTVTVMPIKTGSSSDEEEEEEVEEAADGRSGSDGEGGQRQQPATHGRQGWGQQRQGEQEDGDQPQPQHGRKLSKTALRIM